MAMRRFRVAEDSMRPALKPGDEVVATDSRGPKVGELVVLPHPGRDEFWLVKRMVEPPRPLPRGEAWVVSDNPVGAVDSRTLGPVPQGSLLPVVGRLDGDTFLESCAMLAAEDEAISSSLAAYGPPGFWHRRPGLPTLVMLIVEQQVSLESGQAVYRRLEEHTGGVSAGTLVRLGAGRMRSIGLTRQKARYLEELGRAVLDGRVDLDALEGLPAADARERLLAITGVGPWTADAYLLSALRHPDVFPVGDRALQVGTGELLGLGTTPGPDELAILGEPWRPVRAAAARIIWHHYLSKRGRVEPTDPESVHATPIDA